MKALSQELAANDRGTLVGLLLKVVTNLNRFTMADPNLGGRFPSVSDAPEGDR